MAENAAFPIWIGSDSTEIVRYPLYAAKVANAISKGVALRSILICSTGIDKIIAAYKYKGVRAALCSSTYMGKMTRTHNDANILCLGGKCTGVLEALDILEAWLFTPFQGGRHNISLGLIHEMEEKMLGNERWEPNTALSTD